MVRSKKNNKISFISDLDLNSSDSNKHGASDLKRVRLAEALRKNLRKRKEQSRNRRSQ